MSSSNYIKAIAGVLLIIGLGFLLRTGGDRSSVVFPPVPRRTVSGRRRR